jgi:anti-anti-sigma regulatory factor
MSTVELPADLGIESAGPLQESLQQAVQSTPALTLDGSQVGRLHAASLQVLAALFRQRAAAGLETRIENPSDELKAAARISGLAPVFGWSSL